MKALEMYRHRAGMRQEDLAEKAGVSRNALSAYENGAREPSVRSLQKLADVLGVSVWEVHYADDYICRREAVEKVVSEELEKAV